MIWERIANRAKRGSEFHALLFKQNLKTSIDFALFVWYFYGRNRIDPEAA